MINRELTLVDCLIENAEKYPSDIYLTQPMGGGRTNRFSWLASLNIVKKISYYFESLDLEAGSKIAIYGDNTAYWILCDLAIMMAGHVSVPIYKTMSKDSIRYVLEHSESKLCVVDKLVDDETAAGKISEICSSLSIGVLRTPLCPKSVPGIDIYEIVDGGNLSDASSKLASEDLATIIYTSGSTGLPKGVMHSNSSMLAVTGAFEMNSGDRLFSYLPLAHAAERALVETCSLYFCVPVWFGESQASFLEDLKRCKPTIFFSVPRLWSKFKDNLMAQLPQFMVDALVSQTADEETKSFIKAQLGLDQVRLAITGSAPTPSEVAAWFRLVGLELLDCYGMSENFATSHVTQAGTAKIGYVGQPVVGVEHRISDGGEVQVKSPGQMLGYYKVAADQNDLLYSDGYFRTGDVGEIDAENRLKITGRIKDIFKTTKGKYISPAPIEERLLNQRNIQSACVVGQGLDQPFAVIRLNDEIDLASLSENALIDIQGELQAYIQEVNQQLAPFERMTHLVIAAEDWTVDKGLLTPTQKIIRANIESKYQHLASLNAANGDTVFLEELSNVA